MIIDRDGVRSAFQAGFGMIDVQGVRVGPDLVFVGRRCDGPVTESDTGETCTPGSSSAIAVEIGTLRVRRIAVPPGAVTLERSADDVPELHSVRGRLVAVVARNGGARTACRADRDLGSWEALPAPPVGTICSTGAELASIRADLPTSHDPFKGEMARAAISVNLLDVVRPGSTWTQAPDAPPLESLSSPVAVCSKGFATVLGTSSVGRSATSAVFDVRRERWDTAAVAIEGPMISVWSDGGAPELMLGDPLGAAVVFDPRTRHGRRSRIPSGRSGREAVVVASLGDGRFGVVGAGQAVLEEVPE